MAGTFALTAIPRLLRDGDHKGHLEYVTFIATDGTYTKKWSATNTGTFAADFARIVPPGNAQSILERLARPSCFRASLLLRRSCISSAARTTTDVQAPEEARGGIQTWVEGPRHKGQAGELALAPPLDSERCQGPSLRSTTIDCHQLQSHLGETQL